MSDQHKSIMKRICSFNDYYLCQSLKNIKEKIKNTEISENIKQVVNNSEQKNTLKLTFNGNIYDLTYNDRKYTVYALSLASMLFHSFKHKLRLRVFIPYYIFYSMLLCHEN